MHDDQTDPHPPSAELARLGAGALGRLLGAGTLTSAEVTAALLERLDAMDRSGPTLRSVLRINDRAIDDASALDAERSSGHLRGPLHGIPVVVKDNVDTVGLGATAGSLALDGAPVAVDAALVTQLRSAGVIILGKTNLSEWANFRGRPSASGWSAVGNQTRNPFALNRSPGGSSSGSGAAVAAGMSPLGVGTETDGSILCPAAACGVVGIKPTVGLVSQAGIIPISASQDTAGPMARSVEDAAALLDVLVSATTSARASTADPLGRPARRGSYADAVSSDLRGIRVGVVRDDGYFGYHRATDDIVEWALGAFREAGADVVESVTGIGAAVHADEMTVLCTEFKAGLGAYLVQRFAGAGESPSQRRLPRTLDDVVAFNEATAGERLDLFPQDVLVRAASSGRLDDPAYLAARAANHRRTREEGIDAVCVRLGLDALVAPTMAPAWMIDHVNGDSHSGASWSQAAIAGYPSLNLPIGEVHGLPVGLALWGRAFTEATLIRIASAVEGQISYRPVPAYKPFLDVVT
jgi:amidase